MPSKNLIKNIKKNDVAEVKKKLHKNYGWDNLDV
jgi:hypothetical protein